MSPKQLKPLLQDSTGDSELRELLGEAATQSMPRERADKLAAALAAGTGASLSLVGATSQSAIATKWSVSAFVSSTLGKVVASIVIVASTVGVLFISRHANDTKSRVAMRAPSRPTNSQVAHASSSSTPVSPALVPAPLPQSDSKLIRPRPATISSATRERVETAVDALPVVPMPEEPAMSEVAMLGEAQRLLATSPRDAFILTETANARYPNGVFVQEREVIAIDALLRSSRRPEAQARAQEFLRSYPSSSYARRIRVLLGEIN